MAVYYKAIRPDGTDFRTGTVQWAPRKTKARKGRLVKHPTAKSVGGDASEYLSVSVDPTDLPGASWPMRLLEVEPVGECVKPNDEYVNKLAAVAFRVVREVDPSQRFGPQGEHVARLIERVSKMTQTEAQEVDAARSAAWSAARSAAWSAAWDAAWDAAWSAAWSAARSAAWSAAWDAARSAAGDAAGALAVRDLIGKHGFTQEHYDTLTRPLASVIGPLNPDDKVV